ncbi:MAG TPA: hypothetical protein VH437_09885 [Terriglobales bacterium]|jgi:hypothetical protein
MEILRDSVMAVLRNKRIWLLQFLVNPVVWGAAVGWLLIPEAKAWQVGSTALLALLILVAFLWLHGTTLAYFGDYHAAGFLRVRASFRPGNTVPFAIWAVLFVFLLHVVWHVGQSVAEFSVYLESISPAWLRRTMGEMGTYRSLTFIFWILFWIVVPGLLLPFGLQAGRNGFQAFKRAGARAWRSTTGNRVYWSSLIMLVIVGAYVPGLLINWLPKLDSMNGETISLVVRFALAWMLAATAWTLMASMLGRLGNPESSRYLGGKSTTKPA